MPPTPTLAPVAATTVAAEAFATAPTNAIRPRLFAGRLDGAVELGALDAERRSQAVEVAVAVSAAAIVRQRWRSQHGDTA